jgi:hypothetical protein
LIASNRGDTPKVTMLFDPEWLLQMLKKKKRYWRRIGWWRDTDWIGSNRSDNPVDALIKRCGINWEQSRQSGFEIKWNQSRQRCCRRTFRDSNQMRCVEIEIDYRDDGRGSEA